MVSLQFCLLLLLWGFLQASSYLTRVEQDSIYSNACRGPEVKFLILPVTLNIRKAYAVTKEHCAPLHRSIKEVHKVPVFCICCMPDAGSKMVACSGTARVGYT